MPNKKTKINEFFSHYGLVLILVYFFLAGLSGLFYNYSLNTVGDEAPLTVATLRLIADHSLRPAYPTFYHLPLAVYLYLPVFVIFIVGLFWAGVFHDVSAFKQFVILDYFKFFPLARLVTLGLGLLSIYLIYKISQRLFKSQLAGVIAAYFLATSLLFVQMSHFGKIWLPQTFTIILALYWITDFYSTRQAGVKHYLKSALGVILALGTHLIGAIVYVSFIVAHYLRNKEKPLRAIVLEKKFWLVNLLIILAIPAIYYLNPYGFNNYSSQILPSVQKASSPYDSVGGLSGTLPSSPRTLLSKEFFYFKILWETEPLLLVLGLFGLGLLFLKRRDHFYFLGSFVIVYYLSISLFGQISFYILPIIPFLALSATAVFYFGQRYLARKFLLGLLVFSVVVTFVPVAVWNYRLHESSERVRAMNFIYQNIPAGENIINLDAYLTLNENRQTIEEIKKYTDFLIQKRAYLLGLPEVAYPQPNYHILFWPHFKTVPPELINQDWHFVIVSRWNPSERNSQLEKIGQAGLSKKLSLWKRFPEGASADSINLDLSSVMRYPLYYLFSQKTSGPVVDIYKVEDR